MGTQLPLSQRGNAPQFLAHVCCGQTAGWIKMPPGREVGLGPGHIVLDGDPAPPPPKGHSCLSEIMKYGTRILVCIIAASKLQEFLLSSWTFYIFLITTPPSSRQRVVISLMTTQGIRLRQQVDVFWQHCTLGMNKKTVIIYKTTW